MYKCPIAYTIEEVCVIVDWLNYVQIQLALEIH